MLAAPLRTLHPPTEPYATHRIDVGAGHRLYVEEVGNPAGIPALFLHGGPGGGLTPGVRQFFDPQPDRFANDYPGAGAGR